MVEVDDPVIGKVKMPGIVPRMSESPGRVDHLAPSLGQHNQDVYGELLGYDRGKLAALREEGII